jgi:hypothetical protein
MDRLEACDQFLKEHPDFSWYGHTHVVIEDGNIEDGYVYRAITNIALDQARGSGEFYMPPDKALIALKFLVGLLDLPLPDDWDE